MIHIKIKTIKRIIADAKRSELETGELRATLENTSVRLHNTIECPADNVDDCLVQFIVEYIDHVPTFLEAIVSVTNTAGVYDCAQDYLIHAADYFTHPPSMVGQQPGLGTLMGEAYLAHRLMEEVNDRFIHRCGTPLAPMDMTRANIIMHHLIGEPFANDLDRTVHDTVATLMRNERVFDDTKFQLYIANHQKIGWRVEFEQWPCLAQDLGINISFHDTAPLKPN